MKAVEFQARLSADDTVKVPRDLAAQLSNGQPIRVIILVPESAEDQDWSRLSADEFLKGYAPGDAIYDKLQAG